MEKNLKEWLINVSRNAKVRRFEKICLVVSFILLLMLVLTYPTMLICTIFVAVMLIQLIIWSVITAINNQDTEIVRNNKVIDIVLSDKQVEHVYIFLFVLRVIYKFIEHGFWIDIIVWYIAFICSSIIAKVLSRYLKSKLLK